ncbi:MAG: UDP-N-acetylglucosamine 2-epimerase [Rhodothalassiaceae bacterium]
MSRKRVLAITGIRSEFYISVPILDRLQRDDRFDLSVAVSGAHLSDWHGNTLADIEAKGYLIADRIDNLLMTDRATQRAKGVGLLTLALSQTVERLAPDCLLYVGDREEGIAAALVANYMNICMAHIAGGDPVWGNADDPIRFAISKLAHVHFVFSRANADILRRLGEDDWRITVAGNPSLDAIAETPAMTRSELAAALDWDIDRRPFLLLIKHPLSSEVAEAGQQMRATLSAVERFAAEHDVRVVGIRPNTDPGSLPILQQIEAFQTSQYLRFYRTLPHPVFVNLARNALALVGNSSMGILEAPFYRLPVVNVGHRQQGRPDAGNVQFTDYRAEAIAQALQTACFDATYRDGLATNTHFYGDGCAADRIVSRLAEIALDSPEWRIKRKLI